MTGNEAISYIHSFFWKGSVPGLSRTRELLARLGNPQDRLKFVHIAGTNGKGSTAAMTASILRKAGYRVGLYTSPYIFRFHERMQVNGCEIPDDLLGEITEQVRPHAEAMTDHPTEFELVTAIAMVYFARECCDIVVLEVGMGGELDSTNVIACPEVAVITNIGLDHTEVLGDTLEKIAAAKAGIIKEGGDVVIYRGTPGVEQVFASVCEAQHARLHKADFASLVQHTHSLAGQSFDCGTRKDLFLPLLGDHQLHNAAVVLQTVDVLIGKGWRISEDNIYAGLHDVTWPGRFELLRENPTFIVDGGHNPQCIAALVKNIRDYLPGKQLTILTGVMADKDYADMYTPVEQYAKQFVAVKPMNPRALSADALAAYLARFGKPVFACQTVADGVRKAVSLAGTDGVVLAYGSLYMIGDIRRALDAL